MAQYNLKDEFDDSEIQVLPLPTGASTSDNQTNGSQKTQIVDADGDVAVFDTIHDAPVFMDIEHFMAHQGNIFHVNVYSTVAQGTPKYCQIKTGAKYVHLKQKSLVDGPSTLLCSFIESPTITDGTTAVPILNKNRNSANTPTTVMYSDPTDISGGTVLEYDYLYGDSQGNSSAAAAPADMSVEWILKPNTSYVYKLENLSGATPATFLGKLLWYEKP